jgi:hypothetical protein
VPSPLQRSTVALTDTTSWIIFHVAFKVQE